MNNYEQEETFGSSEEQQDLELNTDIIRNRTETYTSLSDLYHIQLFTNQRVADNQARKEQETKTEHQMTEQIFVSGKIEDSTDKKMIEELFAEPFTIKKNQNYDGNIVARNKVPIIGAAVIVIIFVIVTVKYFKKNKRSGEKNL